MTTIKDSLQVLPAESKVWVYQSKRFFKPADVEIIIRKLDEFINSWDSHGNKLSGAYNIYHDRFIVICVDETYADASGCSIDKSVRVIKELEELLQTELLDKSEIAYLNKEGKLDFVAFNKIKQAIQETKITPETIIFNNSVTKLDDFLNNWKIEAGKSWISKFFNNN